MLTIFNHNGVLVFRLVSLFDGIGDLFLFFVRKDGNLCCVREGG